MKKYLFLTLAFALSCFLIGCSDDDEEKTDNRGDNGGGTEETIKVSLQVTGIADNQATIEISLTEGNFYGAQLIEAMSLSDVSVDYTNEIRLINYVKEVGVDIELPYTKTLTDLRADQDMFTAVIVYDSEGTVTASAYQLWTTVGEAVSWSDENDAGELDEVEW